METILGLVMVYSWVHSVIIIGKTMKDTTNYENTVLIIGLIGFIMSLIGAISK